MSGIIINPYILGPPPTIVTLDASKMGAGGALSGGNRTLSSSGAGGSAVTCLATSGYTTGKYYFEMLVNTLDLWAACGVSRGNSPADFGTDLGQEAGEYGWTNGGSSYFAGSFGGVSGASFVATNVVGVAVDFGTRKVWWAVNNTWINSGNPAAGTGQLVTYASGLGTVYAAVQGTGNTSVTAKFATADLTYSPPSGFLPYG